MNIDLVLSNLLNPPVLFFFLGMLAVKVGSDLDVPQPLPKLFSLYLLLAIGFKGGVELRHGGFRSDVVILLVAAIGMALVVPLYSYFLLRRRLDPANAAAIAATYGSISAVTFIAATSLLGQLDIPFGGHLVAAMALMESPAIVVGVALYRMANRGIGREPFEWKELLREAFFNGSVFVLVGSLVIGFLTADHGAKALGTFTNDIFKGVLCLFLLDMGLVSARRLDALRKAGSFAIGFATLVPLLNAAIAIAIARAAGMSVGDAFLFCVLCASASYIAVPASMRMAIPEANPGVYVTMALALTFPLNIVIGLPLYLSVIQALWR
jgi:hypothetical protein